VPFKLHRQLRGHDAAVARIERARAANIFSSVRCNGQDGVSTCRADALASASKATALARDSGPAGRVRSGVLCCARRPAYDSPATGLIFHP
jgi:hypothetical protein